MPKKVSKSHKVDYRGINILDSLCQNIGFMFREQRDKDYGIDGEIELLNNNSELGYLFKVQVKSTEIIKKSGDKYKMKSISRDDLIYWNNDINVPVFIIAVEINTKKVYRIDSREYYKKVKDNKDLKTTTVYVDKKNELNIENKEKFINFTNELNIYNSKKELIKGSRTERIRLIAKDKGYSILEQKIGNQSSIKLIPTEYSKNFPINGSFSIKENLGNNKFSLSNFEFKIGNELIDTFSSGTIEIFENLEEDELYLSTLNHEYKVKVSKKYNEKEIVIKSLDREIFDLGLYIDLVTGKSGIELSSDFFKLDTLEELSDLLNFLVEIREGLNISVINDKGKKKTILGGQININTNSISDTFVKFITLLNKISEKFNLNISLKELLDSKVTDIDIIKMFPYLYSIVEGEYIIKDEVTLSFDLSDKKQKIPDIEQYIRFIFGEYQIFGHKIPLDIYVEGKGFIEENNGKYIIKTKELLFYSKDKV